MNQVERVALYARVSRSHTVYVSSLIIDEERRIHEFLVAELRYQHHDKVASLSGHYYAKVVAFFEDVRVSLSLRFGEKRRSVLDKLETLYLSALSQCDNNILRSKCLVGLNLLFCEDFGMLPGYLFLPLLRNLAEISQLALSLPHVSSIIAGDNEVIGPEAIA